jgi:hypothetical protein
MVVLLGIVIILVFLSLGMLAPFSVDTRERGSAEAIFCLVISVLQGFH